MKDEIRLLPDTLANQIAAGEVIQRPASAVKELLENAIDAKASSIHLIIKDAGKELIQVIDNGKGMSATDARICFERHATSKIKSIEDLFSIRTMGFRGEALASIAAVARVELKTKPSQQDSGTYIYIENGEVQKQEICTCADGTSIALKNLFYNVPARRNFLKSNTTEMRHLVDEFIHVAMSFPEIEFIFTNNEQLLFHLRPGKLKQRIVQLLGTQFEDKLVPVQEATDFISIQGYCGTPDASSRTRGQQFFFVNNRYIKSAYLNHAIQQAYRELLPSETFPFFVLFIQIDPAKVDINVHPTKQEIKFEEDKIMYAFVNSAIKHALGKYSIRPTLDFQLDSKIENLTALNTPFTQEKKEATQKDFLFRSFVDKGQAHFINASKDKQEWKELYKIQEAIPQTEEHIFTEKQKNYYQINKMYIAFYQNDKIYVIHQQNAHERILYEKFSKAKEQPISIQKCLHPITWELPISQAVLAQELAEDLLDLGYEIEAFGGNSFIIQGVPADVSSGQEIENLEQLLEAYAFGAQKTPLPKREKLIKTLAKQKAIRVGKKLSEIEMDELVQQLFSCEQPSHSPENQKTILVLTAHELDKHFQ